MNTETTLPATEPAWHWVTHRMTGPPPVALKFKTKIVPAEFLDEMARAYREDWYLKLPGETNMVGVPARNILCTDIQICTIEEIDTTYGEDSHTDKET